VIFTHNKDYIIPLFPLAMSDLFLGLNIFLKKLQNFIFGPNKIKWHVLVPTKLLCTLISAVKPLCIFE
jgi:hypothetical protein